MQDANWIKQNYSGYSGWNDNAAIMADFNATRGAGKGGPSGGNNFMGSSGGSLNDLFSQQQGANQDFLGRYTSAVNNQESATNMYGRLSGELGLQGITDTRNMFQDQMLGLEGTQSQIGRNLMAAPDAVKGQYFNADVTQDQMNRLVAERQRPIQQLQNENAFALSDLGREASRADVRYQTAMQQLSNLMGMGMQDQQQDLMPYQMESQMLSEQNARQFTGYSQQTQNQHDMLKMKEQQGFDMSLMDMQNKNALDMLERQFSQQKDLQQMSQKSANTSTGPLIQFPSSSAPTGSPIMNMGSVTPTSTGGGGGMFDWSLNDVWGMFGL